MYQIFRDLCERLLRIPPQPGAPPGDESTARVFRAAPQYFKYRLLLWAIGTVFVLGATFVGLVIANVGLGEVMPRAHSSSVLRALVALLSLLIFLVVALAQLFALAVLRLDYEKRWYLVTDRSLRIREGVVIVREMTITFANVQNLAVSQGPIQRALGIADLVVETAGGGATRSQQHPGSNLHTACFRGIDNAAEVKELIQQRLRALKDSGLGDHEELRTHGASEKAPAGEFVAALRAVHEEASALHNSATQLAV